MNNNSPILTVVMSVFNGTDTVGEAINSILDQDFGDFEFIIVDDGSLDNTVAIIRDFQKKDKRIRLMRNIKHKGLVASLNWGVNLARGKYIARMDADDICLRERFFKQVSFLEENSDYGLVGSVFAVRDEWGELKKVTALPLDDIEIKLSMNFFNPFSHGAVMWRKKLWIDNKLRYEKKNIHCEDFGLWMRMLSITKFKILPEVLYLWTVSQKGVTANNKYVMMEGVRKLAKRIVLPIDVDYLVNIKTKYKKKQWKYREREYLIDYEKYYQRMLWEMGKISFMNGSIRDTGKLWFTGLIINPGNCLKRCLWGKEKI